MTDQDKIAGLQSLLTNAQSQIEGLQSSNDRRKERIEILTEQRDAAHRMIREVLGPDMSKEQAQDWVSRAYMLLHGKTRLDG